MSSAGSKRPAVSTNLSNSKRTHMAPEVSIVDLVRNNGTVKFGLIGSAHNAYMADERMAEAYKTVLPLVLCELVSFCRKHHQMVELDGSLCDSSTCSSRLAALPSQDFKHLVELFWDMFGTEAVRTEAPSKIMNFLSIDFFKSKSDMTYAELVVQEEESYQATIKSWEEDYKGDAQQELLAYLKSYMTEEKNVHNYARYTTVIQSSGMGKSRMIDELAKLVFVVPLCLRSSDKGFPPSDENVRDYLTDKCEEVEADTRSVAFLGALLDHTSAWVQVHCKGAKYEKAAEDFRKFMADGQTGKSHGENRIRFYDAVIETSRKYEKELRLDEKKELQQAAEVSQSIRDTENVSSTKGTPPSPKYKLGPNEEDYSLADKAKKLTETLRSLGCESGPYAVLAVDEAHVLNKKVESVARKTTVGDKGQGRSAPTYFSCMRRGLRKMRSEDVFSLFLSTTGSAFQFTPSNPLDSSNRIQQGELVLIPPFSDVGFDQLATVIVENESHIDKITSVEVMVNLGRPIWGSRYKYGSEDVRENVIDFALEKLLGKKWDPSIALGHNQKLACLAVRMALDFNPFSGSATTKELHHIEHHLRVCMKVDKNFESVKSRASSEPILAEAARKAMKMEDFAAAATLQAEFLRPDIERGARGESVVELLTLLASDMTSKAPGQTFKVVDFLDKLLNSESNDDATIDSFKKALPSCVHPKSHKLFDGVELETAFKNAVMNFSHFMKVSEQGCINRKFLWRMMARGAGVICANGQVGIDIALPYCYYDKTLGRNNVSAIIIQVKNDRSYSVRPQPSLFDAMDPFRINMFDRVCNNMPNGPMPVIRIVAALASETNLIRNFKFDDPRNSEVKYDTTSQRQYTAYDLYVGGMHGVWKPITAQDRADFVRLLDASGSWTDIYKDCSKNVENIRRSQAPGAGLKDAHWCKWIRSAD